MWKYRSSRKYKKIVAAALTTVLILTACGRQETKEVSENASEKTAQTTEESQWELKETLLPDADAALEDITAGEEVSERELLYDMAEGTIYRVAGLLGEGAENRGICIQKLEAPYTSWDNIVIAADEWVDGEYCYTINAGLRQDGSIHMLLQGVNQSGELHYYRAQWTNADGRKMQEIPGEYFDAELLSNIAFSYTDSHDAYYLASYERIWYFDKAFEEKKDCEINGYLWQIMENPAGEVYLSGISSDGNFSIWTMKDQKPVVDSEDVIYGVSLKADFSNDTEGFVCTTEGLWQFQTKNGQTESIMMFGEQGYSVEKVCGICAGTDGSLCAVIKTDGEYVLLANAEAAQGHKTEEQKADTDAVLSESQELSELVELELAVTYPSDFLKEMVVYFNRHNEDYKIVLRTPASGEAKEDFQTRIQAEISSGGGPALLADDVIDLQNAAEKGILRDLTADFAESKDEFLANVWSCGEVNGVSYAIPYSFSVITFIVSEDVVGEKQRWTSGEMMQYVSGSGAETAIANVESPELFSILLSRGRMIDWENGKAYLDSEEAVALLEFAGRYGDKGSDDDVGNRIAEGEVLVAYMSLPGFVFSQPIEALFKSKEVYIGLPAEDGQNGNIVEGNMFSVNQACAYPEGAVAFIQYLLTEECQNRIAKDASTYGVSGFPVSQTALENMFVYAEEQAKETDSDFSYVASFMGFEYISQPLGAKSLEKMRNLLQGAGPETDRAGDISDIIKEETPAYFSGSKSAKEVCDILQNRVQLYLDERN